MQELLDRNDQQLKLQLGELRDEISSYNLPRNYELELQQLIPHGKNLNDENLFDVIEGFEIFDFQYIYLENAIALYQGYQDAIATMIGQVMSNLNFSNLNGMVALGHIAGVKSAILNEKIVELQKQLDDWVTATKILNYQTIKLIADANDRLRLL